MNHLVTIGIPSYERAALLGQTLQSVLEQSYRDIEVIVSINSYDSRYKDIVNKYETPRIRFLKHERLLSMGDNWNQCVDNAHGYYFLLLSDDDTLESECIEKLVHNWESVESLGVTPNRVGGSLAQVSAIDSNGKALWQTRSIPRLSETKKIVSRTMDGIYGLYLCGTLLRTSDLKTHGRFDERQYGALADVASIFLCITRYEYVVASDEYLANYRYSTISGTSSANIRTWIAWARLVHAAMVRYYQSAGDTKQVRCLRLFKKAVHMQYHIAVILIRLTS